MELLYARYCRSNCRINFSHPPPIVSGFKAMGKLYKSMPDDLRDWVLRQREFFVASAPLHGRHVNLSPKGLPDPCLAIHGSNQVAYIDAAGSCCETISHVYENGCITLMFCSFDVSPRILRFYCTGTVIE